MSLKFAATFCFLSAKKKKTLFSLVVVDFSILHVEGFHLRWCSSDAAMCAQKAGPVTCNAAAGAAS